MSKPFKIIMFIFMLIVAAPFVFLLFSDVQIKRDIPKAQAVTINKPARQIDYDRIYQIAADLQMLHDTGVAIHQKYNFNSTPDVQACVNDYGYLRNLAKSYQVEIKKMASGDAHHSLLSAAYDAFACVYCGGTGDLCQNILPAVSDVRRKLAEAGHTPKK